MIKKLLVQQTLLISKMEKVLLIYKMEYKILNIGPGKVLNGMVKEH